MVARILGDIDQGGSKGHRIGGRDLRELLDLSSGALTGLKQRGIAVHLAHDVYDLEATVRNYVKHLRGVAARWGDEESAGSLTAERARLAREQADSQAIKNAVLRKELVPAVEVVRAWTDTLRAVRSRVLAVPSRLRAALPGLTPADVVAIDAELRTALEDLAHGDG
jgi:phage terminase Nu1 subunit (DNA packaging protein)